jgi:hypothetical protein
VVEAGGGDRLLLEAGDRLGAIGGLGVKDLDGEPLLQVDVEDEVDAPHPAGAELLQHPVVIADEGADAGIVVVIVEDRLGRVPLAGRLLRRDDDGDRRDRRRLRRPAPAPGCRIGQARADVTSAVASFDEDRAALGAPPGRHTSSYPPRLSPKRGKAAQRRPFDSVAT